MEVGPFTAFTRWKRKTVSFEDLSLMLEKQAH